MLINPINKLRLLSAIMTAGFTAIISASVFAQASVDQVTAEGIKRADAGAAEQQRVEQIANQTEELLAEFNTLAKVVDGLKTYNSLLQRQVNNQESEKQALAESIDNVALIERQIIPMMTRMLYSLYYLFGVVTHFRITERSELQDVSRELM